MRRVIYLEKAINWADVPGYTVMIKALLEELKYRPIHIYPDALVEAV